MRAPWHGRDRISIRVYQAPLPPPAQAVPAPRPVRWPVPVHMAGGPDPVVFGPLPGVQRHEAGAGRAFGCCGVRGPGMTCWACGR